MKKVSRVFCILTSVYVGCYAVAYSRRKPAANLAYWGYTTPEEAPEWVERSLYAGFYPIYALHKHTVSIAKHTWDRPPPVDDPSM